MIHDYYLYYYLFSILTFINISLLMIVNFLKNELNKVSFSIVIILFESILVGIRADNIGIDSHQYAQIFSGEYERDGLEPFFLFLKFILNWVTTDYSIFFLFISISINLFILFAFKNLTRNYPLAFAVFLSTFLFINMHINIMRQALAIAIVFYAISCLINNQNKRFWIFLAVASLAHYTAVLFSFLYFLKKIKLTRNRILIFSIMLVFLYNITLSDLLFYVKNYHPYLERVYWYFNWDLLQPWRIKHIYYLVLVLLVFLYIYYEKLGMKDKNLFLFYLYGVALVVLFKEEEMVADRFFYYFIPVGIVLILWLVSLFKEKLVGYLLLYLSTVVWFLKTIYLQFPMWFLPPFAAIRT